ncbi:MAG TPA: ABC transporter permease, partial [Candidatus Binatia bacterium]|nr:ABC transporter permease [Candidatus Binatia bacterium]
MNLTNAIIVGFKEIWSHKFRSLLTMLGIILGVSSLVAMSALVKGMENGMRDALIAIGGLEKVRIEEEELPTHQAHLIDQVTGLTMNDVRALKQSAPLIKLVMPEMRTQRATMTRGGKSFNPFNFIGTWPTALEMNQHVVEHGRMFTDLDDDYAQSVCVIGTMVRDELFGSPEKTGREIIPIGETINVNGQPLTIIGMFQHYESEQDRKARFLKLDKQDHGGVSRSRGWQNKRGSSFVYRMKNGTVYIPLNTMWLKFRAASGTNGTPDPRLSGVAVKIPSIDLLEPALQQARNILLQTHHGLEDFQFQTQENWGEQINSSIRNARMSGGIIAVISLLVGGIGIMNIMLASITERVRELGIRKAVGASNPTVFVQIIVESVVIAMIGGVCGLIASYGLVELLVFLSPAENTPVITANAMGSAFLFSVLVG